MFYILIIWNYLCNLNNYLCNFFKPKVYINGGIVGCSNISGVRISNNSYTNINSDKKKNVVFGNNGGLYNCHNMHNISNY